MKIAILETNDPNEFILDISEISWRGRINVDLKKDKKEREDEIAKSLTKEISSIVEAKIRHYLRNL